MSNAELNSVNSSRVKNVIQNFNIAAHVAQCRIINSVFSINLYYAFA